MIPLHDDNPTSISPYVTVITIVLCALVFLWELSLTGAEEKLIYAFSVIPAALLRTQHLPPELALIPPELTLVTSMFLHGGWMHLLGNMLYLWIFGNNVEDAMGHVRFILFYIVCGVIAALVHVWTNPASPIPTLGASGAISGVLGAYLLLYPHARVMVFIPLGLLSRAVYLPAVMVLGFWFVFQIINSVVVSSEGGGVAWGAHIGGFIAGMVLIPIFRYKHVELFHRANSTHRRR